MHPWDRRNGYLALPPKLVPDWLVINIECDDTIVDIRALILRLLTDDTALAPWIPFRVEKSTVQNEIGAGLQVKILNISGKSAENTTMERESIDADVYATFSNAIMHIIESGVARDGILFIIDEVDRIGIRSELASVIRSRASDDRVKFALVGVGTTPQELILNHESIVRQISDGCVEMPPMSDVELKQIFTNAHKVLASDGVSFSEDAQQWIINVAKGHPYYVHLLGKHSLIKAVLEKETCVSKDMAQAALAEIAIKGTARIQETTYSKAIGHSFKREFILKELSLVDTDEISTTAVYQKISSQLSLDTSSISVYVGQLATDKFAKVIEKTRERHYRFRDSLFKAYAAARPFKYPSSQIELED